MAMQHTIDNYVNKEPVAPRVPGGQLRNSASVTLSKYGISYNSFKALQDINFINKYDFFLKLQWGILEFKCFNRQRNNLQVIIMWNLQP